MARIAGAEAGDEIDPYPNPFSPAGATNRAFPPEWTSERKSAVRENTSKPSFWSAGRLNGLRTTCASSPVATAPSYPSTAKYHEEMMSSRPLPMASSFASGGARGIEGVQGGDGPCASQRDIRGVEPVVVIQIHVHGVVAARDGVRDEDSDGTEQSR